MSHWTHFRSFRRRWGNCSISQDCSRSAAPQCVRCWVVCDKMPHTLVKITATELRVWVRLWISICNLQQSSLAAEAEVLVNSQLTQDHKWLQHLNSDFMSDNTLHSAGKHNGWTPKSTMFPGIFSTFWTVLLSNWSTGLAKKTDRF